jgi:hypothetical protein
LAKNIIRTRIKGNGMKAASSPSTEPNFYDMEYCLEDPSFIYDNKENQITPLMKISEISVSDTEMSAPIVTNSSNKTSKKKKKSVPNTYLSKLRSSSSSMNRPFSLESMAANIISPPATPEQSKGSVITQVPSSISVPLPASVSSDMDVVPDELHSGDVVFFEGNMFRYLDHLDLDEFMEAFHDNAYV